MSERAFLEIVSGRAEGLGPGIARAGLSVASWVFSAGARLRGAAYASGLAPVTRVSAPVISIGNLTVGGTGKTPLVIWLARALLARGRRPAVLSRGYGAPPGEDNDENKVIAAAVPQARRYPNPDRVSAAHRAIAEGCDALILDDGFQHRRLHRELDWVLIDATNPFGYDALLPRGLLREPIAAIQRADAVIITRRALIDAAAYAAIRERLRNQGAPDAVWDCDFAPAALRTLGGEASALEELAGMRVMACCGIGNPESFFAGLESAGAELIARRPFPDHHDFTPTEVAACLAQAGDAVLVITEKDAVKIDPLLPADDPRRARIRVLAIEARIGGDGAQSLLDQADAVIERSESCQP